MFSCPAALTSDVAKAESGSSGISSSKVPRVVESARVGSYRKELPQADSDSPADASAPSASPADHFRIKRDFAPHLYGAVQKTHQYLPPPLTPQSALQGSSLDTFVAPLPPVPQAKPANYIWEQSAAGGYYDATGQIKDLVQGDQLFKYGGKFPDGTVVPTTPVVCNFKGHVYFPYIVKR